MQVVNNTSNEDDVFKRNFTIISTIFVGIAPGFLLLVQNGGEVIPNADLKINLILNMMICFYSSLSIAGVIPLIVLLVIHILNRGFMLNLSQANIFILFIQNAIFSTITGSIFFLMTFITFKYETLWGALIVAPISIILLLKGKNTQFIKALFNKRQVKTIWKGIIILQILAAIIFFGTNYFVQPYIYPPKVEWERDYYSFKNSKAIVKIKGIHNVKDAKLTKMAFTQTIPVQYYYVNSNTYLVIDFATDWVIEGNYVFTATIDNKPVEHTLLYIFDGSIEDKEKYINKMLESIDKVEGTIQDIEIKNKISLLREAYLNGNKDEVKNIFNELKGNLSPTSITILLKIVL